MGIGIATSIAALDTDLFVQQEHTVSPQGAGSTVEDSNGNIACEERHSFVNTITEAYRIVAATDSDGKINIADHIKAGTIKASGGKNYAVSALRLETSNQTKPVLTVTFEEFFGDTSGQKSFTPPFGDIAPIKKAQAIGIIPASGSSLQRCTAELTLGGLDRTDAATGGSFVTTDLFGGRATSEAELVACTGAPTAAADAANDWELEQNPSREERPKEHQKSTVRVFTIVDPD